MKIINLKINKNKFKKIFDLDFVSIEINLI